MSKFCFNCGTAIDDSATFCPGCGSKQLPPVDLTDDPTVMATPEPVQNTAPVAPATPDSVNPVPPAQQYFYQPPVAPPEPPKKNKTAITVAVCAVVLCVTLIATIAVLFITGTISFGKDDEKDDNKETTESVSVVVDDNNEKVTESITERTYGYNIENNGDPVAPTESPTGNIIDNPMGSIPYTKGKVVNGEYVNEWAGFKFKITSDYPEADAATYNSLNSQLPAGEYGFISINQTTGTVLTISYENNITNYTLEEIFTSSIELTQSMLESYNPITYGSIEEINICGEEYLYSTMYYQGTGIYGITLMRMVDDKLISIVITAEALSQCYSFLNTFEPASPSM